MSPTDTKRRLFICFSRLGKKVTKMCFSKGEILWFVIKICLIKRSTEVIRTQWQNFLQDPGIAQPELSSGELTILTGSLLMNFSFVSCNTWISTKYTGSIKDGSAVNIQAYRHLLAVGIIWPPPRWMASACKVTSWMSKRTPRTFSSQSTPYKRKNLLREHEW